MTALKEGMSARDFSLEGSGGEEVKLSDYKGSNVILYFYPKDNTPGCTTEACDFRDHHQAARNLNTIILGISTDDIQSHHRFIEKYNLPFILLSDPEAEAASLYGVFKEKNMFGKKRMGIERTTFVIDSQGIIRRIYSKVKVKDHVDEVVNYIQEYLT